VQQKFRSAKQLAQSFPTEQSCIEHLELHFWNNIPVSPFDKTSKVYKSTKNRYICKNTKKYFTVKTGTIFENTKIPLTDWFYALYEFSVNKKGLSSHTLGIKLGVQQKTAWFVLQRLRYAFDHSDFKKEFTNLIEIDETYYGGHEKNKHTHKKLGNTQGRNTQVKKAIFGMRERDGNVYAKVIDNVKRLTLEPIIHKMIPEGATVFTDEYRSYSRLYQKYNHHRVNHGAKEFVNHMAHTNGVENFWSHLKRMIDGTYHWVSKHHLQMYVNEEMLRFNTRKMQPAERFDYVLGNIAGRLKLKDLKKVRHGLAITKNPESNS
jgi:transposase-like protein